MEASKQKLVSVRASDLGDAVVWGYGYNMMGWGWLIGAVAIVLVVVAVIVVLRLLPGRQNHPPMAPLSSAVAGPTPHRILDERYAKGDLTTEEHLERVKHLGSA